MKKVVLTAVALLMMTGVYAQIPYLHYPDAYYFPAPGPEKYYLDNHRKEKKQREDKQPGIRYGINVGTSFMSFGGSRFFSSYVAPSFSYSFSPKFYVSGGIMFEHIFPAGGSYIPEPGRNGFYAPMNNVVIYGQGTYFVRPNLSLTGTIVKNLNQNRNLSPFYRNYTPDSYSLRLNYRISDHFFFGAEFRYSEPAAYSPFYPMNMSPYGGFYPYSPY